MLKRAEETFHITSKYSTITRYITLSTDIIDNAINIVVFTHLKFFQNNQRVFYLTIESIFFINSFL
jgi:hypothetical protein